MKHITRMLWGREGAATREAYPAWACRPAMCLLVVAGCLWAGDSIQAVSPLTKIDVLKIQVQGYDTNKVYLGACVDKKGTSTVCVASDMLPYFEQDTANGKLYQPQGVNLRFVMEDYGKDSTIVNAYNQLMKKLTLGRVKLK